MQTNDVMNSRGSRAYAVADVKLCLDHEYDSIARKLKQADAFAQVALTSPRLRREDTVHWGGQEWV